MDKIIIDCMRRVHTPPLGAKKRYVPGDKYLTKTTYPAACGGVVDFSNELPEEDLKKILVFTSSKGITIEKKIKVYLMHLLHHETHHRGMISIYLEMPGKENDYSNLYPYG